MQQPEARRSPPYPADVRAKGWRFEIDYERIDQSDTWALAPVEVRPWLLMLWLTAWRQTPCGALPADDGLIAARIGMAPKLFERHRAVLLRGWWLADDGRLYHNFIVGMVELMLATKNKEKTRKADWRQRKGLDRANLSRGTDAGLTRDSSGTDASATPPSHVCDDTGTGTGTGNTDNTHHPRSTRDGGGGSAEPTKAGEVCRALKAKGLTGVNPSNPELRALIDKGVDVETFEAAAEICVKATPPKGMAYLLGIVKRQLGEAAEISAGPALLVGAWDANRASIEAKARELGIEPWNEHDISANREMFTAYTARVRKAVEDQQRRVVA